MCEADLQTALTHSEATVPPLIPEVSSRGRAPRLLQGRWTVKGVLKWLGAGQ